MKNLIILTLIVFTSIINISVSIAQPIPITLEKVLELAGANNLDIKAYKEQQNLSKEAYYKAKEWLLPTITIGANSHSLFGAVMNSNGKFYPEVDRNNFKYGLGLQGEIDLTNGFFNRKSAKLEYQASKYKSEAEKNQSLLQCINAYYELLTQQQKVNAYQGLILRSEDIVSQIQLQVEAGLRYQSELLLAKSNKNHIKIQMLTAQKEYRKASSELLSLLNLEQITNLVVVDTELVPLEYTIDNNDSNNRPELRVNELEIKALKTKKKSFTIGLILPEITFDYKIYNIGDWKGPVVPVNLQLFPKTDQHYPTALANLGVQWNIPIGALVYNGDNKMYKSHIRLKQIETTQIRTQINKEISITTSQIEIGKQQLVIAEEGLSLSTEALNQSIERQKLGTAKPFEVFQAQEFYLQSQIDYITTVSNYNKAQFALKIARGGQL